MVKVACTFNMNLSTVGTIYKSKDRIMKYMRSAVPLQSTIISKKRGKLIEETEKLLGHWMEHQWQRRVRLSLTLIQEAKSLFEDLKAKAGESVEEETFAASHGSFQRFKKRAYLHQVFVSGEVASADEVAAEKFPINLKTFIDSGGYAPQQIFNVDETDSSGKMPEKTYICRKEKTMPGFKAAKDRFILMLGGNALGILSSNR